MKTRKVKEERTVFHIKKNDLVEVITGEEKERRGRILEVIPEKTMAIVEGINLVKKHQRARSQAKPSGIVTVPAPIHVSNLVLICPKCGGKRVKQIITEIYGTSPQRYDCKDCGYVGSLVLDVSEREKSETDIAMEEDLMRIKKELGL